MNCSNCGSKLSGDFCTTCGTKNNYVQRDGGEQQMENPVMAHINRFFEEQGCQSAKHFTSIANFSRGLYRTSTIVGLIVFVYYVIQNIENGIIAAIFHSSLVAITFTYIIAVIVNGSVYNSKYLKLCNTEYPAKGKPLDPEQICRFMAANITLPQFSNWSYGYDQKLKCGFVEYVFKGAREKQIILLYPEKDRFEIQMAESYAITNLFGIFILKQAKYYNNLTTAKTIIVTAMNYYLERV